MPPCNIVLYPNLRYLVMNENIFVLLIAFLFAAPAQALDKKVLAEHIRETYSGLPPGLEIELGEPKKSEVEGFDILDVTFRAGPGAQTETLYLSKDGKHYILGGFKNLSVHPDNERLKSIDLAGSAARGPKSAPVTVVEYTDFQCIFCKRGYGMMTERIMKDYDKQVRWIYKSLPLTQIHPWAEPAAVAVECAGMQGGDKLWKLHDALFENQEEVTPANFDDKLVKFLDDAKVDKKKFNACYDKQEPLPKVQKDAKEAGAMGIGGTPAFVVNGHLISGADYEALKRAIDESLEGKHGKI